MKASHPNDRWDKIDLENLVIQFWRPKIRNESTLHLMDRVFEILSRHNETAMIEYVFTATDGPFIKSCQELKNAIVALGLEDCKLPILRPTTASRFVLSGMSLYEVIRILMTYEYQHDNKI